MAKTVMLGRIWDFVFAHIYETRNVTTSGSQYAWWWIPLEIITGITLNISKYLDFGLCNWVIFWRNVSVGPPELVIWLGVSHQVGPHISNWLLTSAVQVVSCDTVQRLINLEHNTEARRKKMEAYDETIETCFYVKYAYVDVDGRIIQEGKLFNIDM